METEKIDVPKFDGFECIGVVLPKENLPCKYLGKDFGLHDADIDCDAILRLCYRKIKPKRITFERVGTGIANAGEWTRSDCGDFIKLNSDRRTECEIWHIVEDQS